MLTLTRRERFNAAHKLYRPDWSDEKNEAGYAGTSYSRGVAGHGSLSPYEVHIALLAAGPSFKPSFESELPTSNVDLVPTILHLHQLPIPATVNGRVMYELLINNNSSAHASRSAGSCDTMMQVIPN